MAVRNMDCTQSGATEAANPSSSIHEPSRSISSKSHALSDAARWQHLSNRTQPAIPFIYGVVTTKIYCLPTCPSRLARRANVTFFSNPIQAAEKGFRACKRCKPDLSPSFTGSRLSQAEPQALCNPSPDSHSPVQQDTQTAAQDQALVSEHGTSVPPSDPTDPSLKLHIAISLIKSASQRGERISLSELANKVGLSKWHLQRAFKRRCGKSPRELGEEILAKHTGKTIQSPPAECTGSKTYHDLDLDFQGTHESFDEGIHWPMYQEDEIEDLPQDPTTLYPTDNPYANMNMSPQIPGAIAPFPPLTDNGDLTPSFSLSLSASTVNTPSPLSDIQIDDFDTRLGWSSEYSKDLTPEVSGILRDLFPEIYEREHEYQYRYDDGMMI